MANENPVLAQAMAELLSKLAGLGYKPLPEQVLAYRVQFKSHQGRLLEVVLLSLDLDKTRSISLNQRELDYTLRNDLWIFLVLTISDMEPMLYLIPSIVFATPNNIFVDNQQPPALRHFSTWEIKVFTRAIPELSRYALHAVTEL